MTTNKPNTCTEKSASENYTSPDIQGHLLTLKNLKVCKDPSLVLIIRQISPVHILPSPFCKILFNII
jgi:hypothetical protein